MNRGSTILRRACTGLGIFLILGGAFLAVRAGHVVGLSEQLHQLADLSETVPVASQVSGCFAEKSMPDPECTPGAVFPKVTKEEVCTPGYSKKVRNVSQKAKDQIYRAYDIASRKTGEYQVDHFISLELGGSNEVGNLWPEAAEPKPGFHEKDEVENFLHKELCDGEISLKEVEILIGRRWKEVYQLLHDSGQVWHNEDDED